MSSYVQVPRGQNDPVIGALRRCPLGCFLGRRNSGGSTEKNPRPEMWRKNVGHRFEWQMMMGNLPGMYENGEIKLMMWNQHKNDFTDHGEVEFEHHFLSLCWRSESCRLAM